MATAYVAFGFAGGQGSDGFQSQVVNGAPSASETVTTSASPAASTNAATGDGVVSIFCASALYATVGASPTASATNSWYIPANVLVHLGVTKNQRVSLLDV